jgi:predicted Zn-dependent protease
VLGGLAAGCATNPVTGQSELMLLSEEEELQLGKQAFGELAWQQGGPLRIDPATQGYLDAIVRKLHQVSHRSNLPVDFTLESASEPNAWAIPGHTAMNRGLLQYLENEAQFAFVMGHEMGHVAARHSAARQSRATLGSTGLGILGAATDVAGLGGLGGLAVGATGAGTQLLLLSYDRGQELQADQLGALYMARAGYDPNEVRAHEVLNRAIDAHLANLGQRRGDPSAMSQILSTHPRHEEHFRGAGADDRSPSAQSATRRTSTRWCPSPSEGGALRQASARRARRPPCRAPRSSPRARPRRPC